jgi:hypothetical protein
MFTGAILATIVLLHQPSYNWIVPKKGDLELLRVEIHSPAPYEENNRKGPPSTMRH